MRAAALLLLAGLRPQRHLGQLHQRDRAGARAGAGARAAAAAAAAAVVAGLQLPGGLGRDELCRAGLRQGLRARRALRWAADLRRLRGRLGRELLWELRGLAAVPAGSGGGGAAVAGRCAMAHRPLQALSAGGRPRRALAAVLPVGRRGGLGAGIGLGGGGRGAVLRRGQPRPPPRPPSHARLRGPARRGGGGAPRGISAFPCASAACLPKTDKVLSL